MSQVLVWKSDADCKLFEDKTKYQKHLRVLATQRAHQRKIQKMEADRAAFIERMGNTVTSIKHLEEFIAENWEWFFTNGMKHTLWASDKKPTIKHKLNKIQIDVRWSESVSNTHSCPRDGVQNWSQRANREKGLNLPEGYPGWTGSINFVIDAGMSSHKKNPYPLSGYGSDYFKDTGINTGGGGGSGRSYSYELRLYAADFPAMALAREQARVWSVLSDAEVAQQEFA